MRIDYSKRFIKKLAKSPVEIQLGFKSRLRLFIENRFHPLLNNHALGGVLAGYRSINVTGDWRAIFREFENGEIIFFEMIGTHSELYK
jgi:addiction module RelE/StbE family toxin